MNVELFAAPDKTSPKFQVQEVGEFVDVSVKPTATAVVGEDGENEKLATGAGPAELTTTGFVVELVPDPFEAECVTV